MLLVSSWVFVLSILQFCMRCNVIKYLLWNELKDQTATSKVINSEWSIGMCTRISFSIFGLFYSISLCISQPSGRIGHGKRWSEIEELRSQHEKTNWWHRTRCVHNNKHWLALAQIFECLRGMLHSLHHSSSSIHWNVFFEQYHTIVPSNQREINKVRMIL